MALIQKEKLALKRARLDKSLKEKLRVGVLNKAGEKQSYQPTAGSLQDTSSTFCDR